MIVAGSLVMVPQANAQVVGSSEFQLPKLPPLPTIVLPQLPVGSSAPAAPLSAPQNVVEEVLRQINAERAAHGVGPVTLDLGIGDLAKGQAHYIVSTNLLDHSGRNAEILARVPELWQAVVMWLESPAHREIMLDGAYTRVGLGIEYDNDQGRWVLVAQFS